MLHTRRIRERGAHRPVPMPAGPWAMFQRWCDLLFAHWPVDPEVMRALVPAPLELDTFEGKAWIGITPFRISAARPRLLPPVPGLSSFPEMNVRTYVRADRPGIFFFSLDTTSLPAVLGARAIYRLPYRLARMGVERRDGWVHYASRRVGSGAEFVARYRPVGAPFTAEEGTLEHFLVERYALFQVLGDGSILRGDIHHPPWTIQPAEAEIERNTVLAAHGVRVRDASPLLHLAARQDTLIWLPKRLR